MLARIRTASFVAALVAVALASASSGQGPIAPPGGTPPGSPPGGSPPGAAPPGLAAAVAVQERYADQLLDSPGVVGTGVGLLADGSAVIRVYTEKGGGAVVSSSLDGVPVEQVETGMIGIRAPTDRFPRPVPIGVSSGLDGVATGTLGARVTDGTNVYALSNNHVFAGINTASVGDPIIQPGNVDGGNDPADRIGTLHAYQSINFNAGSTNTMDAAIALTTSANVGTATPSDGYGTPSTVTAQASPGLAVQKYGRTTGLQQGTVAEINVTVDVCYLLLFSFCLQEARFVNQISVSPGPFSAPGDSGSLIVTQNGNQPLALLFAGGDGLTIGTPIDLVLQRFGVTIDGGGPPPNGPPGAPTGLSAISGDESASLSWNAPTFDGGSSLTAYKVYRGTSPGGEIFLQSVDDSLTSFTDTGLTNGQAYYYKVSAENANGEGPLSNEASATPSGFVPPLEPLPSLDDFNRPNENPLSDAGRWANGVLNSGETGLVVSGNALACTRSTTCTAWRQNTQYGPDAESWAKITTLPGSGNGARLYVRMLQPGSSAVDGYVLKWTQQAGPDLLLLDRMTNGSYVNRLTLAPEIAAGDTLLLRAKGSTLEVWLKSGSVWSRLGVTTDSVYSGPGYVGVSIRGTSGRLDDFGAYFPSAVPPGAPTGLSAISGDESASLSWNAPTFDGGSSLTAYKVYRGTSPGGEIFLQSVDDSLTSFTDTGLTNGQAYYYKVSAENANGEGPLSNEASATPSGFVPPLEPLPSLDDFNRPNENPLSDAGRWANGVLNSGETGLVVSGNALACTRSTTCTAWRQNTQYGPDAESWAKITTLPGSGNGARLYVRMLQPGSSAVDGYVLKWTQQAGPDLLLLDRMTNGSYVNRLTLAPEIAAGDTLLLRAKGSTLEVWLKSGSVWSRLGVTTDSVYSGPGYVGVSIRGTSGRLDDFGAYFPSAVPPGAPTGLSAISGDESASLSWNAPTFDGGSSLTAYKVYRGTSPGGEIFLQSVDDSLTSFTDTGLTNGQAYYYKVSAENANGEGPLSNEASATPSGFVPPLEPLPSLDDFNRPNENPLSDAGRWANGVLNSGETGLVVSGNALACTRSTTCTAWRQNTQYGPDAESWAKITTLPGSGNGARLYVRMLQPGSSAVDGYVLKWTQQAGPDLLLLDRMTNGSYVNRLTLAPEIAAGDTLLLRAKGSTLEVWLKSGSVWSRLGVTTDSVYSGPGYVGVSIRGTSGRLDDFGAR